ncbi:MAG: MerR family transcriptional regulator [Candidatus Velamenicoccus archaeovorus]
MIVRRAFPIAELARRTGVPPTTIHHYLRLGLLPPPERSSSNRFLYDERHVQAVRLIRALRRRRRFSLPVIQRILPDLMGMERADAFRPEMWDRAVDLRASASRRRAPRARLLRAAVEAFADAGFAEVNVDELCRAARIAKGSFYRHFRSKEALFAAAAEAAAGEVVESYGHAARDRPEAPPAEVLLGCLQPRLPIFLELLARASQGRPAYAAAAHRVLGAIAGGIDSPSEGGTGPSGEAILEEALALVVRRTVTSPPFARPQVSRSR